MISYVFRILEIEPLQQGESVIDLSSNSENQYNQQFNSYLQMAQIIFFHVTIDRSPGSTDQIAQANENRVDQAQTNNTPLIQFKVINYLYAVIQMLPY